MPKDGERATLDDTDGCPALIRVDSNSPDSTVKASIVNVFKGIVGSGVFSLSAGVGGFSDSYFSLVPGLLILFGLGAVSAYCFWLIGRLCLVTGRDTYAGLFEHAYGKKAGKMVEALLMMKTCIACIMYEVVLGDLCRDLGSLLGFEGILAQRSFLLGILNVLVLLPLGLMRSFAALAPIAALGNVAMVYVMLFMGVRYFQGAYAPGGQFYEDIPLKPTFNQSGVQNENILVLISMIGTAYIAHYNSPKFVKQLKKATSRRFAVVSTFGFLLSFIMMAAVMIFGFLTFGGASQGLILNNYAVKDSLAAAARGATMMSVGAIHPFVLAAFRDGVLQWWFSTRLGGDGSQQPGPNAKKLTTVISIAAMTCIAMAVDDLGFLSAIVGTTFASAIIYVLPALAMLGTPELYHKSWERAWNKMVFLLGVVLAIIGAYVIMRKKLESDA